MKQIISVFKSFTLPVALLSLLAACSGSQGALRPERHVLDASGEGGRPSWVREGKDQWQESGSRKFRLAHSLRGDERVNACYELAKLDAREQIVSEIWSDFKASTSHSTQSASESMDEIFMQSRQNETRGNIRGLRFTESYFERYLVNGTERIDCFVLGEMTEDDYRRMESRLLHPLVEASPEIRKAVEEKHKQFFEAAGSEKR